MYKKTQTQFQGLKVNFTYSVNFQNKTVIIITKAFLHTGKS